MDIEIRMSSIGRRSLAGFSNFLEAVYGPQSIGIVTMSLLDSLSQSNEALPTMYSKQVFIFGSFVFIHCYFSFLAIA
jgi:hypothetical protein